ncbi:LAMI_0H15104g1_1 [Lachancea mirantina]|uniref:LAMI_0H15104g1_1 n=1 Tax=Lachancea mirantina TaxID=1230905 RepID=A0A1G4KIC8_9SACH|nr:LAMI_0H15104g1_1 [Lachancea mirantina]
MIDDTKGGEFQCLTCDFARNAAEAMKHQSATRHKSIMYSPTEEEISCEECQNNNIHLLQIVRFGGEDMSLLCNSCLCRDYTDSERPSTSYTLANGSLLHHFSNYLKVRDSSCSLCGTERHLNVNAKRKVLCDACLVKQADQRDFVSEASGKFVYLLLGIQEQGSAKSVHKKGGRMVGRRKKKGDASTLSSSRRKREKKPLTTLEEMAKKAYDTKKVNSLIQSESGVSLRSFKGVKATQNDPSSKAQSKTVGYPTGGKTHAKGLKLKDKPAASNRKPNPSPKDLHAKNSPRSQGKANSVPKTSRSAYSMKGVSDTTTGCTPTNSTNTKGSKVASTQSKKLQKGNSQAKPHKTQDETGKARETPSKNKGETNKDQKIDAKHDRPAKKNKTHKSGTPNSIPGSAQNEVSPNENKKATIKSVNDTEDVEFEEGEPVKRFVKYVPKMSYPNLTSYLSEFSHALFLEERLENDFLQDFQITWPKNPNERAFVIAMKSDSEELKKLLPANLIQLGRLPFTNQQPLMLTNQDETKIWYSYVREIESRKSKLTILLELYPWCEESLPRRASNDSFKILPCSAQVNRIMFAMTKIENPKFIKLLLGQESVKQVNFQNRLQFTKETLNDSQKSAIQHVMNNSVTILQGPPGTGKTSTIEEIILQLIQNFHTFPILCVAASNIAIDNIAEKFMVNRPDIKILRIVSQTKEAQYNEQHQLGGICLHNIVNHQLPATVKETIAKLRSGIPGRVSKNQYNKLLTTQNTISDRHVAQAQIIFTTNIASGGRQLKAIKELPVVIMDESTQSSEVSTLVPLSLPGIKRFVFVGDEKQLSSFSNVPQLELSLFERILLNGTYSRPHLLDTQYRMHPAISEFPIRTFYESKLKDGVTAADKSWPGVANPLFFLQCDDGPESKVFNARRGMRGFTYNNKHEARVILGVIHKLIVEKGVPRDEIAVITPYSSQRDLVSELLEKDPIVNPSGVPMVQQMDKDDVIGDSSGANVGAKVTINVVNGVYVATVDSFQGHEKQFVIFSCVRNNKECKIGFVKDRRRLNVALTRAKSGLVIVGNKEVLRRGDPLWSDYVNYLDDRKVISSTLDSY